VARGDDGAVGDAHPVVNLVLLLQPAQDGDGVLHRGLADEHRLEAPGEGRVLFDVLAIFIQGGRADAMQVAARQGRLQQVGGVHRPLALAGADQGVHLVDEEDDRALGRGHLVQHRLQPLLELAAVFRAGDQAAHVERHQLLVFQALGHVAVDDAQRQAFDDGGLADARLADQHGVVLGAAGQHLDGAADLLVAADDWVELAVAGGLGEVAGVALQRIIAFLGRGAVGGASLAQVERGVLQARGGGAGALQRVRGLPAFLGDGDQQPLGGDEGVAGGLGVGFGLGEDAGGLRLHVELARAALDLGQLGEQGFDGGVGRVGPASGALDQGAAKAVLLFQQHLEQVLGAELLVAARERQRLGRLDRLLGAVGIEIDVHGSPRIGGLARLALIKRKPRNPDVVWRQGHTRGRSMGRRSFREWMCATRPRTQLSHPGETRSGSSGISSAHSVEETPDSSLRELPG
jgi:hypothetical protein